MNAARLLILGIVIATLAISGWFSWPRSVPEAPVSPHQWDPEGYWGTVEDWVIPTEGDGPALEVVVPMPHGTSGLVVDVVHGEGASTEGWLVTIRSKGSSLEGRTDRDGMVVFADLAAGRYSLLVESDRIRPLFASAPVVLGEGEEKTVSVEVGSFERTVRGRVFDATGRPVEGIQVIAQRQAPRQLSQGELTLEHSPAWAISDREGRFSLERLGETDYLVRTREAEGIPSVRAVLAAGASSLDLHLRAVRNFELSGVVTDRFGAALSGVEITALGIPGGSTTTDASGAYQLSVDLGVRGSSIKEQGVIARGRGFYPSQEVLTLEELERAPSARHDFTLDSHETVASFAGVLLDPSGNPLSDERVSIHSAVQGLSFEAISRPDGRFELDSVPAGEYQLSVHPRARYADHTSTIDVSAAGDPSELPVEVTLEELSRGTLTGTITDPAGSPLPDFGLRVGSERAIANTRSFQSDRRGKFEVSELPAGELRFETRASHRVTIRGVTFNPETVSSEVDLVVDRGIRELTGKVVDSEGRPILGAEVMLLWRQEQDVIVSASERRTISDDLGEFRFDQLARAPYTIRATAKGHRKSEQSLDLSTRNAGVILHLWRD